MSWNDRATPVIRTHGLTKSFGAKKAVDNLDITLRRGEIYGFVGRNGSGKTTTIRLMLGLITPTKGSVEIMGEVMTPGNVRALQRIGCLVETPGFYSNLSVYDNLEVQRNLLGVRDVKAIDEVIDLVGLSAETRKKAAILSTGARQRLGLARALLHRPEILILDEPANGQDPAGIHDTRMLLKRLSEERQTTVFMSSHNLPEVQQMITRLGIIHEGRLVEEIDYEELRRRSRVYLEFQVSDPARASFVLEEKLGIRDVSFHEEGKIRVYEQMDRASEITRAFVLEDISVSRTFVSEENLEDHFLRMTQDEPV